MWEAGQHLAPLPHKLYLKWPLHPHPPLKKLKKNILGGIYGGNIYSWPWETFGKDDTDIVSIQLDFKIRKNWKSGDHPPPPPPIFSGTYRKGRKSLA